VRHPIACTRAVAPIVAARDPRNEGVDMTIHFDAPAQPGDRVAELDRQVQRGSLFTQAVLQRTSWRISQAESMVAMLVDALARQGLVDPAELGFEAEVVPEIVEEEVECGPDSTPLTTSSISWPSVAIREDPPDAPMSPEHPVDCAARMHICKAACCHLKFPLSATEVDAGVVKWDIGHPYIIRHGTNGCCTHNERETGRCGVYEDRPRVCRVYSCVKDTRIWKDFDNMVLNEEWLEDHFEARDFTLEAVVPSMEVPVALSEKPT
jgi:hypothetical protein